MTIFNTNQWEKSGRLLLTVVISIPYDLVSCFDDCLMTILVTFKSLWKKITNIQSNQSNDHCLSQQLEFLDHGSAASF